MTTHSSPAGRAPVLKREGVRLDADNTCSVELLDFGNEVLTVLVLMQGFNIVLGMSIEDGVLQGADEWLSKEEAMVLQSTCLDMLDELRSPVAVRRLTAGLTT